MVLVFNQQRHIWLPLRCIRRQVRGLLESSGYGGWDVGVHFVDNERMQQLNRQYRKKDRPTDILSFPFHQAAAPEDFREWAVTEDDRNLGDMYLGMPYIVEQCRKHGETVGEHLPELLAHGLCHLMGYDHELDADYRTMTKREQAILREYSKTREVPF
ncbi:hypothetical protein H4S02_000537 [Coemansia sp. RSA 2611]|nr:hypothetical protein H4S01_002114 [Coemansia sp. RSA 2610]KAJ2392876.1 hypothetical protein H4S02_000537 [Coemansia sp. RSA 2611]